ncbi:hypothetical protein AAG747_04960 [Rapidithrix thailandica]|uniref:Tetratricopeptide repeat protein n=1 Tax=Rapidithrix thailandica TaxID=413964 RepID=A0AAW9S2B7_9BACT
MEWGVETRPKHEKSIALIDRAIQEFPSNNDYKVFKAIALYNVKHYKEAMNFLLNVIATTSRDKGIQEYEKPVHIIRIN